MSRFVQHVHIHRESASSLMEGRQLDPVRSHPGRALTLWASAAVVGCAALATLQGCETDEERIEASAGEPCDCFECNDLFGPTGCSCAECSAVAFDPERNEIVRCDSSGRWVFVHKCSGGGSVSCSESGHDYEISCLDEKGRQRAPLSRPSFAARAGERCLGCDYCKTGDELSCVCATCTEVAFDSDTDQILTCGAKELWEVTLDCPGGATVGCRIDYDNGYGGSCLDENGQSIPMVWPSR